MQRAKFNTVIDAACGTAANRYTFGKSRYTGFDVSRTSVTDAADRYPDDRFVTMSIEKFARQEEKAELVICVQTINTNQGFTEEVISSISQLIELVEPDGTLIFNVGSRTRPIAGLETEILQQL